MIHNWGLLLVVWSTCLGLGISLHEAQQQILTRYSDKQYQKELQQKQQKLKDNLQTIKEAIQILNKQLQNNSNDQTYQLLKLSQGLADERDSLYDIEKYLQIPYKYRACGPNTISSQDRVKMNEKIKQVNKSLQQLENQALECGQCMTIKQIKLQIKKEQNYLTLISEIVNNYCSKEYKPIGNQYATGLVNLQNSKFKDNLKANNWQYGNITEAQYRLQVFSQAIRYNLTSCPLEQPFYNRSSAECFLCPGNLTFYLGQRKCQGCPEQRMFSRKYMACINPKAQNMQCQVGYQLNLINATCDEIHTNYTGMCPPSKPKWNSIQKYCEMCPISLPKYRPNNNLCEKCPINSPVYNSSSYQCQSCPTLQPIYNQTTKACQKCPTQTPNYNHLTKQCEKCPIRKPIYSNQCKSCQIRKPYYNQTTKICQQCPKNMPLYNNNTIKCQECPKSKPVYNYDKMKCQQCPQYLPFFNITKQMCQKCKQIHPIYNNLTQKCQKCPTNTPHFNQMTAKCQFCPEKAPIYNQTTRLCKQCPMESPLYNKFTKKCEKCPQNIPHFNTKANKCFNCPQKAPIFNDKGECQACPAESPVFNPQIEKCSRCEKPKPLYNKTSMQCESCPINTTWNNKSQLCSKQIQNNTQPGKNKTQIKNQTQHQSHCNSSVPFWNSATLSCEICPSDRPLWDTISKKCILCPQNHIYIELSKRCQCKMGYTLNNLTKKCRLNCAKERPFFNQSIQMCVSCPSGKIYDYNSEECKISNTVGRCPPSKPYYDSQSFSCKQCQVKTSYNNQTGLCQKQCQVYQKFNSQTNQCIDLCTVNETYNQEQKKCKPHKCNDGQVLDQYNHQCRLRCQEDQIYNNISQRCEHFDKKCPENTTLYVPTNQCLAKCRIGQIYNFTSNKCKCPGQLVYNETSQSCQKKTIQPIKCADPNAFLNIALGRCVCKTGYIMRNKSCQKQCFKGQKFNNTTKQCQNMTIVCAQGQHLDPITNQCKKKINTSPGLCKDPNAVVDPSKGYCVCKQHYIKNSKTGLCEKNCLDDQKFNKQTGQCQTTVCPQGQVLDPFTHQCKKSNQTSPEVCKDINAFFDSLKGHCICKSGYQINQQLKNCVKKCSIGEQFNIESKKCQTITCNQDQILNKQTGKCENPCRQGLYFDASRRSCVACADGKVYNSTIRKCQDIKSNCQQPYYFDEQQKKCKKCDTNQQYNQVLKQCVEKCRDGYKFSIEQKKCVLAYKLCTKQQYYDYQVKMCKKKPICSNNQTFNYHTYVCQKQHFITNLDSSNLILSHPIQQIRIAYQAQKASHPHIQDCPITFPYYSTRKSTCEICPQSHPYFNLQHALCQNCGQFQYDPKNRHCKVISSGYTLQRFLMNIQ